MRLFGELFWSGMIFTLLVSCSSMENVAPQLFSDGNDHREAGRFDEAEVSYREALELNPSLAAVQFNLALLLTHMERPREAVILLAELRQRDEENLLVLKALGWALWWDGDFQGAYEAFESVVEIFKGDEEAWRGMALSLDALKMPIKSLEAWRQVFALSQKAEDAALVATAFQKNENLSQARQWMKRAYHAGYRDAVFLEEAAEASSLAQIPFDAVLYRQALKTVAPEDVGNLWELARLELLVVQDYETGLMAIQEARQAGFDDENALQVLLEEAPPSLREAVQQAYND